MVDGWIDRWRDGSRSERGWDGSIDNRLNGRRGFCHPSEGHSRGRIAA